MIVRAYALTFCFVVNIMVYIGIDGSVSYLSHYGVKGMKWGVRHDYKPKGRRFRRSNINGKTRRRVLLSAKAKKRVKIGLMIAGASLAVVGGVYLYKSGKFNSLVEVGKQFALSGGMSLSELKAEVSNGKPTVEAMDAFFSTNPKNGIYPGSDTNCVCCTIVDYLKNKGITNCTAKMAIDVDPVSGMVTETSGFDVKDIRNVFKGSYYTLTKRENSQEIRKGLLQLFKEGDGGIIGFETNEINPVTNVYKRHAINWFIKNGSVYFSDSQKASDYVRKAIESGIDEQTAKNVVYNSMANISDDFINKHFHMGAGKKTEILNLNSAKYIDLTKLKDYVLFT